jgi:hypothetical protein
MKERMDFEQHADDLLDHALASYTPITPRVGLEDRVRARLSASSQPARRLVLISWNWAIASALTASIVLAVLLRSHSTSTPQSNVAKQARSYVVANSAEAEKTMNAVPSHSDLVRRAMTPRAHAHQPTQLQLIAQLVSNGPEAITSLARIADEQQKPIEIQPLAIKPSEIEWIQVKPIEENPAETGDAL